VLYQSGLCVPARGKHSKLGWEWVEFMTRRDVQIERVESGVAVSGNRLAAEHYASDPIERAFLAQVQHARQPWGATVERYPLVEELGQEMLRDLAAEAERIRRDYGAVNAALLRSAIKDTVARTVMRIDAALQE
jgi:hypothetical protein